MKNKIMLKLARIFCKAIIPYIDDMQIRAEEHKSNTSRETEYNVGMIAAYNNIRSLITNPVFAKNYEWYGEEDGK